MPNNRGKILEILFKFLSNFEIEAKEVNALKAINKRILLKAFKLILSKGGYEELKRFLKGPRALKFGNQHLKYQEGDWRLDGRAKLVISAAYRCLTSEFRRVFENRVKGLKIIEIERLFYEVFLGKKNPKAGRLDEVFSVDLGVSKPFISAITLSGTKFSLLKELVRVIDKKEARGYYWNKKMKDLLATSLKNERPFDPVWKLRKQEDGKKKRVKTDAKVPISLAEFDICSNLTIEKIKKHCEALKIKEKVFDQPYDQPFSSRLNPEDLELFNEGELNDLFLVDEGDLDGVQGIRLATDGLEPTKELRNPGGNPGNQHPGRGRSASQRSQQQKPKGRRTRDWTNTSQSKHRRERSYCRLQEVQLPDHPQQQQQQPVHRRQLSRAASRGKGKRSLALPAAFPANFPADLPAGIPADLPADRPMPMPIAEEAARREQPFKMSNPALSAWL